MLLPEFLIEFKRLDAPHKGCMAQFHFVRSSFLGHSGKGRFGRRLNLVGEYFEDGYTISSTAGR